MSDYEIRHLLANALTDVRRASETGRPIACCRATNDLCRLCDRIADLGNAAPESLRAILDAYGDDAAWEFMSRTFGKTKERRRYFEAAWTLVYSAAQEFPLK